MSTTWLLAPQLNPILSSRTSLISQYETPTQAFSGLFRLGDVIGALLLLAVAIAFIKSKTKKTFGWMMIVIAGGLFLDPIFTTSCHIKLQSCEEYHSLGFVLHAIESVVTAFAIFAISIYDAWLRKKIVSVLFVVFQLLYGVLFVSQLANQEHFKTPSQFFYQACLVIYLAWLCRDLFGFDIRPSKKELKLVKRLVAGWAFLNGIVAILISLAHIQLLGRINGIYFAGDNAWLAQHGVIIGVVMLYLSRHIARGEMRAKQIFLVITGIETIKYSVISPHPALMIFYLFTFCGLFVLRDDFNRGIISMTWKVRLKDLYYMLVALLISVLVALIFLDRDNRVSIVASRSFEHFYDYVSGSELTSRAHINSVLLAHTISVFLVASIGSVLWILFRPYKLTEPQDNDYEKLEKLLIKYAYSPEDYFKIWPPDKNYYWQENQEGFVAYKLVGSIAFALANPVTKNKEALLQSFMTWAKAHRITVCFLLVDKQNLHLYQKVGFETLSIGSSAVIDIENFLAKTSNDKWWRWQKNKAERNKYTYHCSLPPHSTEFINNLKVVSDSWLNFGAHHERGFALGYFNEQYLQNCRIHFLQDKAGRVIAFTNQLPNFKVMNTFSIDILRYLADTSSAMPYLLYKTIEATASDNSNNYKQFDLGFVPFAKAERALLAIVRTLSKGRFSSKGLEQFKNKFDPEWQPYYLAYTGDFTDLALIALNLEKAMEIAS